MPRLPIFEVRDGLLACMHPHPRRCTGDRPTKQGQKEQTRRNVPYSAGSEGCSGRANKKKKPAEIFDSIVQLEVQDFTQMMMTGVVGWAHMLLLGSG